MWHCDQYQMLGGKDFCRAFPAKIDLTYQLLFVGLTMCVTIKGCCRRIVNTWIVLVLSIYYCAAAADFLEGVFGSGYWHRSCFVEVAEAAAQWLSDAKV